MMSRKDFNEGNKKTTKLFYESEQVNDEKLKTGPFMRSNLNDETSLRQSGRLTPPVDKRLVIRSCAQRRYLSTNCLSGQKMNKQ